jgi:hypothetical protein
LVCLLANGVTWLVAADGDISRATDLSSFITLVHRISLLRASLAFDVGAYVLLVPLIVYLWSEFDVLHPARSRMYAAGGLAYSLVGATGAVVLFAAWPPLMHAYEAAAGTDRLVINAVFESFTDVVYRGMWNVVGAAGIGVWLLGTGTLLRPTRRGLGFLGATAGVVALADAVFVLVGAESAAKICLAALGVLAPLWILLVAVLLLRGRTWELVTESERSSRTPTFEGGQG